MATDRATVRCMLLAGKLCHIRNSNFEKFDAKLFQSSARIHASIYYFVVQLEKKCVVTQLNSGIEETVPCQSREFEFDHEIKQVAVNNDFCLMLLTNGDLHKFDMANNALKKVNFLNVEGSDLTEQVTHIATGATISVAVTNKNRIFNIPNQVFELPRHEHVKKVSCGLEHALLLTTNGDVYSWGIGLRGQLGHGEICSVDKPRLIEALAGVKIIDIAAGGWTSTAVSVFGDLYTWGWNTHGQLGLKVSDDNPAVYALPQIVEVTDDELSVDSVACGCRHTLLRTSGGRYFVTGSNKYGQLGLYVSDATWKHGHEEQDSYVDEFIEVKDVEGNFDVSCGYWSSMLTKKLS